MIVMKTIRKNHYFYNRFELVDRIKTAKYLQHRRLELLNLIETSIEEYEDAVRLGLQITMPLAEHIVEDLLEAANWREKDAEDVAF